MSPSLDPLQLSPSRIRIGLSNRLHVPVLKMNGLSFPLWHYRRLKAIEKTGLFLDSYSTMLMLAEMVQEWQHYLPPFSLEGKTVLDVGAGCGETAWFFLEHGARKVICIERDPARVAILRKNKDSGVLKAIEICPGKFTPQFLELPHDYAKFDIEGYECGLLPIAIAGRLGPTVIETHNGWITEQFEGRGFRRVFTRGEELPFSYVCNWEDS